MQRTIERSRLVRDCGVCVCRRATSRTAPQVDRGGNSARSLGLIALCLVVSCVASLGGSAACAAEAPAGRLKLRDDSSLGGVLSPSAEPGRLRWMSPAFQGPLEFSLEAVSAAVFPAPAELPAARGSFGFELAGGTYLTGDLLSLDADGVVVSLPSQPSPVRIERRVIQRIVGQSVEAAAVYLGPVGADGWVDEAGNTNVREVAGQLVIDGPGSLLAEVGLPDEIECDLELSWRGKPDFGFQFGVVSDASATVAKPRNEERTKRRVAPEANPELRPFNLEVVDGRLVALGENDSKLGLAAIEPLSRPGGRVRVRIFLDQVLGRFVVFSSTGELRADLTLPHPDRPTGTAVRLVSRSGAVRLESLRIRQWNGRVPQTATAESRPGKSRRSLLRYEDVVRYDAQSSSFVCRRGRNAAEVVSADEFPGIVQATRAPQPAPAVSLTTFDGARISGAIESIQETRLEIRSPGIEPPLVVLLDSLSQLAVLEPQSRLPAKTSAGTPAVLQTATDRVHGWLLDSSDSPGQSRLIWQTALARNAQPLNASISGTILYGDVKSRPAGVVDNSRNAASRRVTRLDRMAEAARRVWESPDTNEPAPAGRLPDADPGRIRLHLRTGDALPCAIAEINELGVMIRPKVGETTEIPHADVQVLELIPGTLDESALRDEKRERLLTLPRIQQNSPPTHLLRSTSGDYVRGQVLAMDEQTIQLNIRQSERALPRHFVSHIFWLHPEDLEAGAGSQEPAADAEQLRVQSLHEDGTRLTFLPTRLAAGILTGSSRFLGECRVDLASIDQLILGRGIEQSVAQLPYHRWRLQRAVEPRSLSLDAEGRVASADAGTDSPLVGQTAPDFRLGQLDGPAVQLKRLRGKLVVLEFWASWSEPCVRRLPVVASAVAAFPGDDVELIAVNLQEQLEPVEALLARLELDLTVALDLEGLTAQNYDALAVPQTVIVNRDGKIARVFGGTSNDLGDAIRRGLDELLEVR